MAEEGILLESGTNEVELLEFVLGGQSFGVNVAKIQCALPHDPAGITRVVLSHPSVLGVLLYRGHTIPLVDLAAELGIAPGDAGERRIDLVMRFNNATTAFLVDGVERIHRVSWERIQPMSDVLGGTDLVFTGSVDIDGREVLLADMERIVADVLPRPPALAEPEPGAAAPRLERAAAGVLVVEDSSIVRAMLVGTLRSHGYERLTECDNGRAAYELLAELKAACERQGRPLRERVALVISDIEMPQMDGLTLCRRIREQLGLGDLPVVMFSSLIDEQMVHKCRSVGASGWTAKSDLDRLLRLVDHCCHHPAPPGGER